MASHFYCKIVQGNSDYFMYKKTSGITSKYYLFFKH
jgi:hypothetical protein